MATKTQGRTSSGRYEDKGTRTAPKGMKRPPAGKKGATKARAK